MKNWKKRLNYTIDGLLVALILLLGYTMISMMFTKSRNFGVPQVFGQSILYVATDSMDDPDNPDCLAPGIGIIISKADPSTLVPSTPILDEEGNVTDYKKDGDIVTFYYASIKAPDTHRLINVERNESENQYYFTTMGDNPIAHEKHKTERWSEKKPYWKSNSSLSLPWTDA